MVPLSEIDAEVIKQQEDDHVEALLGDILSETSGKPYDLETYARKLLSSLARILGISQGAFFLSQAGEHGRAIRFIAGYAYHISETETLEYQYGEGLSGQVAKDGQMIRIEGVPEGYIQIISGLGKASPRYMIIFPVLQEAEVLAVIELASFQSFSEEDGKVVAKLCPYIAERIMEPSPFPGEQKPGPDASA